MATPKVSVIVPNYNYARYLPDRIDSILKQTFQDFELILLDDASTDGSAALLERWRNHPKVSHIVVNDTNSGSPFAQWERGIALAHGEYIWIAEADDLAAPGFLAATVAALDSHPAASVAIAMSALIDSEGNPADHAPYEPFEADGKVVAIDGNDYVASRMLARNTVYNASMTLFRREHYASLTDRSYMRMRSSGDWYLWAEMLCDSAIVEIHQRLNSFRLHSGSTTKKAESSPRQMAEGALCVLSIIRAQRNGIPRAIVETSLYRILRNLRRDCYSFSSGDRDDCAEIKSRLEMLGVGESDYRRLWLKTHLRKLIPGS